MAVHDRVCKVCGKQFQVADGQKQVDVHRCKAPKDGTVGSPRRGRPAKTNEQDTGH